MTAVRLPTPLRPYAEGHKEVEVQGESVGSALQDLVRRFPGLQPHLYDAQGGLRLYVNVFRNDEDVRTLQGEGTPLRPSDRLLIVPSIAGGRPTGPRAVDYSALRANQATIIGLLLIGFVVNGFWIPGLVGGVMLVGTLLGRPGFLLIYRLVRALRLVRPDPVQDHAEPHLFAQGVGGSLLAISFLCLSLGLEEFGWVLTWIVIALAALNLFGGFCVGCAMYYWLNRLRIPGFRSSPPAGTVPGRRPPTVP